MLLLDTTDTGLCKQSHMLLLDTTDTGLPCRSKRQLSLTIFSRLSLLHHSLSYYRKTVHHIFTPLTVATMLHISGINLVTKLLFSSSYMFLFPTTLFCLKIFSAAATVFRLAHLLQFILSLYALLVICAFFRLIFLLLQLVLRILILIASWSCRYHANRMLSFYAPGEFSLGFETVLWFLFNEQIFNFFHGC